MENLNLIKPEKVQNIINKFCYTIGMIPTSYKVSLTYEEQIIAIGHYLEETVIPALNNNAEAVAELQSLFVQLKDYVENYFTNVCFIFSPIKVFEIDKAIILSLSTTSPLVTVLIL